MPPAASPITICAVIPTYNRRELVVRAINSVINQHLPPAEVIVIDDGSTDGTADHLRILFGSAVKVVSQINGGVSAARRRGILEASSEWIAFLDSDDEWTAGRLEVFRSAISRVPPEVGWIFGDTQVVKDAGDDFRLFAFYGLNLIESPTIFDDALKTQFPFQFSIIPSSLVRRSLLVELGAFVENLRTSEDFLISFRAAIRTPFAAVSDVVTRVYRTSDLAASSLDRTAKGSADYFRARVIAFDESANRFGGAWRRLHEEAVRGLCLSLAREGVAPLRLSLQQFRHRVSAKAIAFSFASLFGPVFLRNWHHLKGAPSSTPNKYDALRGG